MRIVPGLDRGMRVLNLLASRAEPLAPPAIARELDIPRSAIYEIINTLTAHRAVQAHPDGRIGLGQQLLVYGSAYGASMDLVTAAQPIAREVMTQCQETVQVGILDGRQVLYLVKADSPRPVRLVSTIGSRVPAHCTAIGKMLLSGLPDEELNRRLAEAPLERMTGSSITDPDRLRSCLDDVRSADRAFEWAESNEDVACLAVPVRDSSGAIIAAMSMSAPITRLRLDSREEPHLQALRDGANRLSTALGHVPPAP